MLGYYINNKPLALSPETSVKIIYYNPACYFDEIPGDVAMGIDLDANETNRDILGNPDRFEKYTTKNEREFPNFEIRYSGKLLLAGTLVIQSASDESYSGWCRNNVGNLGKEHRDKFIYDIPAFRQNITFQNKASYNPITDPYGCPSHYNPDFFRDKGFIVELTRKIPNPDYVDLTDWEDLWNKQQPGFIDEPYKTEALTEAFRRSSGFTVNALNPDHTVITATSTAEIKNIAKDQIVNVLSPMLFLNFVIEMLLRDAHFYINNNAIKDHPDLQKLILYNNFDITHVEYITQFVQSYFLPTGDPLLDALNNKYGVQSSLFGVSHIERSYDGTFIYHDLLPKIKLKDFFLSIQNLLNVCFQFHADGKVDIVDREKIMTDPSIDISDYIVGTWNMGEKKDVTLKFLFTHDDDDIMFAEKWTDIDDQRIFEGDPIPFWRDLELVQNPYMDEIRFIADANIYVRYQWIEIPRIDPKTGDEVMTDGLGWKVLSGGFQHGFFNRKKIETEEIKTEFSSLMGGQTTMTMHKGNMETVRMAYENFSPRLLFYLGNNVAKNETANISLDWEKKDKGLLATRWPKWKRFWAQRQPVSIDVSLPLNMIDYVARNITGKFRSREGDFIIETMETEFSIDSIGETTITGYKGNYQPTTTTLDEHWFRDNLVLNDTLIDFNNIGLIFNTNLDLFPFGTL